jgi:PHD/YefM family antitoxin component YafN of YafNO toxin-antitoxin module
VLKVEITLERELGAEKWVKSKPQVLFGRDQLVNTATISRHFSKIKAVAKIKPLFITDNGEVDMVLLSYDAYEQMFTRLQKLEEEALEYRAEEAERDPESSVDWRSIRRGENDK